MSSVIDNPSSGNNKLVLCRPYVCMCVCVSTFSNIFSSEITGPIEAKFHMEPPWDGETKVCSNGPGHMTKMAAIYSKTLKVKYKGILFYEILMDCVARKRMQKTTSNYLKWFPRYCDLNFYMLSH